MNYVKTGILMLALTALLVFTGHILDNRAGGTGYAFTMLFLLISLGINFGSYWFSDKIVLSLYKAQPVSERDAPGLYEMTRRITKKAEMPMPRIYICPMDQPNAFATGRNPKHAAVCFTRGILRMLPQRQLEGVLAHEIAHVRHYDTLIMCMVAAIAGIIMFMSRIVFFSALFGGRGNNRNNPLGGLFIMILAPIMALMIQMAVSRSREYHADKEGGNLCGDPNALADALQTMHSEAKRRSVQTVPATSHLFIVNPAVGKKAGGFDWFSTHPSVEKRVERLRKQAHRMNMT